MASILDFLNTNKGAEFITKASEKTLVDKDKITTAMGVGLPVLLGTIKIFVSSKNEQKDFFNILENKKNSEDFPQSIDRIISPEGVKEGEDILKLITNNDQHKIAQLVSSILNMEVSIIEELFKMAVNLLAGILAGQFEKDNINAGELESLIETAFGATTKYTSSFLETILDKDNTGKFLDDINSMIIGGGNKGKKDGGILGGMTGGK